MGEQAKLPGETSAGAPDIIVPDKDKHGNKLVIKLIEPIEWGEGNVVKELSFIKPKAKHMRNLNIQNMKMGDMIDLIAILSNEPSSMIDQLSIPDLQNINEKIVKAFF